MVETLIEGIEDRGRYIAVVHQGLHAVLHVVGQSAEMYRADGMRAALEVVQDAQQPLRCAGVARIGPPGAQPAPDGGQELGGLLDEERQDLGVERLGRRLRARCDWFGFGSDGSVPNPISFQRAPC
jgi:hypothetical protein